MADSYNVKGLLQPLWRRVGKRDDLAALTGIQPTLLSAYNSGTENLSREQAIRIVVQVPGATLDDLAIPPIGAEPSPLIAKLDQILERLPADTEVQIAAQLRRQARILKQVSDAVDLLSKIADRLDASSQAPPQGRQRPA